MNIQNEIISSIPVNQNKYFKLYCNILESALANPRTKASHGIINRHHYIPNSIIKNDNKIALTIREHIICHLLLPKFLIRIRDIERMTYAIYMMTLRKGNKLNSRLTESLLKEHSKNQRIRMLGENNPQFGRTYSEEELDASFRGKNNPNFGNRWSQEQRDHLSKVQLKTEQNSGKNNPMYGYVWSEEQKTHQSNILKNRFTGKDSSNFSGFLHTPWGIFESREAAFEDCPFKLSKHTIRWRCKNSNKTIKHNTKFAKSEDIGKTFKEIGYFISI